MKLSRRGKILTLLLCLSAIFFIIDYSEDQTVFAMPQAGADLIETGLNMNLIVFLALAFFFGCTTLLLILKWR